MKTVIGVLVLAGFSISAEAQTIADVARQARSERQAVTRTRITTPMIRTASAETATAPEPAKPPAPQTAGAKPAAAATPAAAQAAPVKDEKFWRGEFDRARADLKRAEDQILVLENDLQTANRDFLQTSFDPNNAGRTRIQDVTTRLDAAKLDRETARNRISQLEEEFRRSGAPPGWLR